MITAILVALTTLCICSLALLVIACVAIVKFTKIAPAAPVRYDFPDPATPKPEISAEEMARARKQFNDEMQAFQEMMNYNVDKAYGIDPKE